MKILILAMLLAVGAGASPSINQNASSEKAPSAQSSPTPNPAASQGNEGSNGAKGANNEPQQRVKISELPPITVRTGKGDIIYLVFSGLLVIVGGLQVWLLFRTLIFVRRQAHEMKRQRAFMRLQWKSMQEQAKLMEGQLSAMTSAGEQTKELVESADIQAEQLFNMAKSANKQVEALLDSAEAMQKSIALQQAALEQWVDILNWRTSFIPPNQGIPAQLRIQVDVVNPTNFPLTLEDAHIVFAGNLKFFFRQHCLLAPRNPYTVDVAITLNDESWKRYWQEQLIWIRVEGDFSHTGSLRELRPQPLCGHLICAHKHTTRFEDETPAAKYQNPN
ncbi:MAG TPA: hypothetical protein VKG65_04685 [Terriglobales bacterium]|nr:hypothetical protein [Terriglobales bacterium]